MSRPEGEQRGPLHGFFPVPIEAINQAVLDLSLYIKHEGEPVLYREAGVKFTADDAERLKDEGVSHVLVSSKEHEAFRDQLNRRLDEVFHDESLGKRERATIIRSSCIRMIEEATMFPNRPEAIAAVADISRTFATWASDETGDFSYLLDMSAHDFYTATHMLNVGVGCGLLVCEAFPDDEDLLPVVMQGGLLHDVGKRGIPQEILNKVGQLEPDEWRAIRSHPAIGYEQLRVHDDIPDVVLSMTRDHHERIDGEGYPRRLSGDAISSAARLCAIVDVYDALTSARAYHQPLLPMEAIGVMQDAAGTHFDVDLLAAWDRVIHRMLDEDPSRAASVGLEQFQGSILDLIAHGEQQATGPAAVQRDHMWDDDRRGFDRLPYKKAVRAAFISQGKECPVDVGETFTILVDDLGRGGVALTTPWPLSLNDTLVLSFPVSEGRTASRRVRVVRMRKDGIRGWVSGAVFENGGASAA